MNNIKNFYPLIGPEKVLENWVVKLKDRPDLIFGTDDLDYISASPRPLLFFNQLPLKWLQSDPGFFIFLRAPIEIKLPHWIIPPKISNNQRPPYYSFISTREPKKISRVLVINHHETCLDSWESVGSKYTNADIRWISYSCAVPSWPVEKNFDFRQFCYHPDWAPDVVSDINYGQGDTFSPVHLHALHCGARLDLSIQLCEPLVASTVFSTWYGTWNLFENT